MSQVSNHARSRRALAVLLTAIVALGAARAAYVGVRPNLVPKRFGVVDAGKVYRSGQLTPGAFEDVVTRYGIRTVIDLGSTIHGQAEGEARNQRTADAMGVKRYVMSLYGDSTGNPNYYIQAIRLASDPANQPVLVHCGAGTERTGLFCILYRSFAQGVPMEEGFREAQSYGHNAQRTPQVRQMMERYGAEILTHVRDGGQIESPESPVLPDPVPAPPRP